MTEINGKILSQTILDRVRNEVSRLKDKPVLAVVMVGEDPVSAKYVEKKSAAAQYCGIKFYLHRFPASVSTHQLLEEVKRIQLSADSVVVQLPLPEQVDVQKVLDALDPKKDPDCLSAHSIGQVLRGSSKIHPPTAGAVKEILDSIKVKLDGKHVVLVGQGRLIGKPLAAMLMNLPVTLTVCGLGTKKLGQQTAQADILITGVGKPGLIKEKMVKKGAVVIDAGTSLVKGKLVGDVDFIRVSKKAKHITPAVGGIGPLTVSKLLENVCKLCSNT